MLPETDPFNKKITYFLNLPSLAPIEIKMLKNIVERKDKHKEWVHEKEKTKMKAPKTILKRKNADAKFNENRNIRRKLENESELLRDTDYEKDALTNSDEIDNPECSLSENSSLECHETATDDSIQLDEKNSCETETPVKRKKLLTKFGISTPSPLRKSSKITEEEMKRFSVSVHLWAEQKYGSTRILQQLRLKENHFQEILSFAGPGTKFNLIKERSVLQYKHLWRNTAKSKNYFRGHQETGFETNLKKHDPSRQFCPFEHCETGILSPIQPLEIDLIFLTPKRNIKNIEIQRDNTNANRQLFEIGDGNERVSSTAVIVHNSSNSEFEPVASTIAKTFQENTVLQKTSEANEESSPTKEELTRRMGLLTQEIKQIRKKIEKKDEGNKEEKSKPTVVKCKVENCGREFTTKFGLIKHQRKHHSTEIIKINLETCTICGKEVTYIDKHMKAMHKEVFVEEVCEICKKCVKFDMKKHRGVCIYCPFCGKKNSKKDRLLKHIAICKLLNGKQSEQIQPLDLTSPLKRSEQKNSKCDEENANDRIIKEKNCDIGTNKAKEQAKLTTRNKIEVEQQLETAQESQEEKEKDDVDPSTILHPNPSEDLLHQKRTKFPFDKQDGDETYLSEFEDNDPEEYTVQRRRKKDILEIQLREIDGLENLANKGDDEIVNQFRLFMQTTTRRGNNEEEYSQNKEKSTVQMYTRAVQNEILKAFHELFNPFDSRWLLDCTTKKECTFEGEERRFVTLEEPIYFTSRVLRKALEKYDSGEAAGQRSTLLCATGRFMNFIEMHFNNKLSLYGREPLKRVMTYHYGVKSYIEGTKEWKAGNKERARAQQKNKVLKEYENPNYEAEILERYQKYIKSDERLSQIRKILTHSNEDGPKPSDKEWTELGQILMGEIVTSTGCRPVVVYRLTVGSYVGKTPGFNPRKVTKDDCVLEEEHNDQKLYRRLNPNLPPKHLACKHQIEHKSAKCPVNCKDKCDPEGFNIFCDWDKTQDSGSSYLHLVKPIKDLMDLYDITRSKFFKGRKFTKTAKDDWLEDENTPFFLNSLGSPFKSVDLQHVSDSMGIDVTAYSFRRIVSTWALSHESEEIRSAEEEALQHGLAVARENYLQNKQVKPQALVQTYIEEECLLPEKFREEIKKTEIKAKTKISDTEEKRQKQQHKKLLKDKEARKQFHLENRCLGP